MPSQLSIKFYFRERHVKPHKTAFVLSPRLIIKVSFDKCTDFGLPIERFLRNSIEAILYLLCKKHRRHANFVNSYFRMGWKFKIFFAVHLKRKTHENVDYMTKVPAK